MRAVVVEHDIVTPFGRGVAAAWRALSAGECAISRLRRFPTRWCPDAHAAVVPGLEQSAVESLCMQMLDPLLRDIAPRVPGDASIVLATITGEVDLLERHVLDGTGALGDSRLACLLAKVQGRLGNDGDGWVVSAACASATAAIAQAASLIEDRAADAVLVVACDAVTEFVFAGFVSLGALSASRATPFDRHRDGLSLGEAAGCMLLVSEERAEREGRRPLAAVTGWGSSNDARHMTGPCRSGAGLRRAIGRALSMAGVAPAEIRAVSAHGTGTAHNDSMEMVAFRAVFGDEPIPTFSVKGALGHAMGAVGLVEASLLVHALREGTIPGTVGCRDVDDAARGWVTSKAREIRPGPVLSTNSGFGGVNVALVLEPVRLPSAGATNAPVTIPALVPGTARLVGAGWIRGDSYGCLAQPVQTLPASAPSLGRWAAHAGLEPIRTDDADGLDARTSQICFSAALALRDGGLLGVREALAETGIVATDGDGCVRDNERCFRDYAAAGRVLARGALFVRTLPTSAACEAAIRLGLEGPTSYVATPRSKLLAACERALGGLRRGEARAIVVSYWSPAGAIALLFAAGSSAPRGTPGAEAVGIAVGPGDLGSVFQALRERGVPEIGEAT